jgi:hypothetical protein
MPMRATISLNLPAALWTAQQSAALASNVVASIKMRTSEGLDTNDKPFKPYSKKPIYIPFKGARLKPKGGRVSRTGRSMFFAGGYHEYKVKSRKHGAGSSALVDLVASGILMNNLVVLHADARRFVIGLTPEVRYYGYGVNQVRPYLGLSSRQVDIVVRAVEYDLRANFARGGRA